MDTTLRLTDEFTIFMRRRRRADGTIRLRLFYLKKFADFLGRELVEATTDDMYDFLNANADWSGGTQQSVVSTLRVFYEWAHRKGYMSANEAEELWGERAHRPPSRIASEEAIHQAVETSNDSDRAMILLGAECGLRVSEISNLNASNRQGEFLTIIGKGNKQRSVHLTPELKELLERIESTTMRHGNYFPGQSGRKPIHPSTAWRHITKVLNSNPHSLRHRAGTVVYRNGGNDLRLAQEFLGHESPTTTSIYIHVERDDLRRASAASRVAA